MAATLRLNKFLGDPNRTMLVILAAMILVPIAVRRAKSVWTNLRRRGF